MIARTEQAMCMQVATVRGNAVYKVTGTRVLETGSSTSKDDPRSAAC